MALRWYAWLLAILYSLLLWAGLFWAVNFLLR